MNIILLMNILILVCAQIGSAYGVFQFTKKKRALYFKMVTAGLMCLMFASLFQVIYMLTQGYNNAGFHVGVLGIIGKL